ncbi:BTAD domain-containing putative transcriptional regulator [Nonomuraea sp. MG754425]|uniref:AfsR/SARP family transcriptional regulator n=1 Tax=Nonomuraea sp. MG754425 TaxID=2570319 RepID=UPI001F345E28|nr:BTAD domain-containing putative transcriptional regulator [Nonomuraea sp. MG754425]
MIVDALGERSRPGSRVAVEFRLLGSIEAHVNGRAIDVGPARQRCVLAALLMDPNQPIPADQLVERVWADRAPRQARGTLRTYLTRLRHALAVTDEVRIARQASGYLLTLDPGLVDLHHFHELIAGARSAEDPASAIDLFSRALALWRGEPFTELDTPWIRPLRAELETERIGAELDLGDLLLSRGRHDELLAALHTRSAGRPLDERLAGQLMLALYRGGRQGEALDRYQSIRDRLAEELGADPSPPLQRLHQRILAADPALELRVRGPEARSSPMPMPRQLPAPPQLFTGRARELRDLTAAMQGPSGTSMVTFAIEGTAGIGKTWLALRWAHQQAGRFPDGQLYVDLRGFAPGGQPVSPATAIRGFLDALGVAPTAIPADPDAQAALYRSLVAGKRMLVLLDNAATTGQVAPLLPGSSTCTVLITSRDKLTGLVATQGARPVLLDVLSPAEARDVLTRHLGADRLTAEPEAARDLLRYCGGLPLALGIVAARVVTHPGLPLSGFAEELRDHSTRLDALDTGEADLNVRAVFSWSRHGLDAAAADLLGLLSLAPGPDISLMAAASLAGSPPARTGMALRELDSAHLIQQHVRGRYRMHDLIRVHASEQAHRSLSPDTRTAALRRLVDFYLHTAYAGDRLLQQHREPIEIGVPVAGCRPEPLQDQAAALSWFDAEHAGLLAAHRLAADQHRHAAVWRLAWALRTFHRRRGRWHEDLAMWQAGLAAVESLGDVAVQIQAHRFLGNTWSELGRHPEARHHLRHALSLSERTGDTAAQAHVHMALGWVEKADRADQRAVDHLTRASGLYRTLGNPVWEADALSTVGWFHAESGQYEKARAHCEAALRSYRRHADPEGEADTLNSLGYIAHHTGRHAEALDHYERARALFQDLGHAYNEADTLDRIGHTQAALERPGQARHAWGQALDLYRAQRRVTDAERVQTQLAALDGR